ncbi:MAG: azurin [Saprospiraceae bacterium]|nr:azurin [Saprospiraceae bacterium]
MKQFKFQFLLLIFALSIFSISSCKNEEKKVEEPDSTMEEEEVTTPREDTVQVTLEGDDMMKYNLSNIDAYEGQVIVLTLKHIGKMAKNAMGHNFVLLAQGTDVNAFAEEAVKASTTGYVPADHSKIIAYTDLIGGGESTTITFNAPAKGSYDYICTFPGHHMTMKGKLSVE